MRLHTRFHLLTLVSLGAILGLGGILASAALANRRAAQVDDLAAALNQKLTERSLVRDDFLLHAELPTLQKWQRQTKTIQVLLEQAERLDLRPQERDDLEELKTAFNRANALFVTLTPGAQEVIPNELKKVELALHQQVVSQSILASYQLFTSSKRLNDLTSARLTTTHRRTMALAVTLAVGALVVTLLNLALVRRLIQSRVARLEAGIQHLAAGDLSHRIAMQGADELADLGHAFDAMAHRLQEATRRMEEEVDERRKAEAQVMHLNAQLGDQLVLVNASNRELESFSYSVSHDLRAPLRHIAGFSDMLQEHLGGNLDGEGRRYLDVILQSSQKMGQLIDDLLSYSRLGRTKLAMSEVDLNPLAKEVIELLSEEAKDREVVWVVQPLPQVVGDAQMLRLVLQNLVANALKFTRGRSPARIEIGTEAVEGEVRCFVRDNGVGFDMKYAEKLYTVFQRLHQASQFEGTGIGLANVRRTIERHGGRVWAEGKRDAGATFWFTLPLKEANP